MVSFITTWLALLQWLAFSESSFMKAFDTWVWKRIQTV